jgi:cyclophilin family peptidyl-prolyl cis-trans isomerase
MRAGASPEMRARPWLAVAAMALLSSLAIPALADKPRVKLATTAGDIVIELEPDRAPLTVANFLQYVTSGYYNGTIFHRVVPGFIVQGGRYTQEFNAKEPRPPIVNESGNGLGNLRGSVGMARGPLPHTADSQFFINLADNGPALDPKATRWGYAVFGTVVEGLSIAIAIANTTTVVRSGLTEVPPEPVVIESAVVLPDAPP